MAKLALPKTVKQALDDIAAARDTDTYMAEAKKTLDRLRHSSKTKGS